MAQYIGLQIETEDGASVAEHADGLPVEVLDLAPRDSACLRFIDVYGDTLFNQLQIPVLTAELASLADAATDPRLRTRLDAVIGFLRGATDVHLYVRCVGD